MLRAQTERDTLIRQRKTGQTTRDQVKIKSGINCCVMIKKINLIVDLLREKKHTREMTKYFILTMSYHIVRISCSCVYEASLKLECK